MKKTDSTMRGGAGRSATRTRFKWRALLWALIYPRQRHRILPTVSGTLLIGLSLGVGMAAYNASNNILFITLSLLLACLVLSGVLSWLNFRKVSWRLTVTPPLRAGQEAVATLRVRSEKRFLPTYGLWFEFVARSEEGGEGRAETTFTARGEEVRAALRRAEQALARGQLWLGTRVDAGSEVELVWTFRPVQRGRVQVELERVGSLFPFGFLRKSMGAELREAAVVWPAPVEYRRQVATSARRATGGERVARVGAGSDLLALRRYELGDSHRLIHWKASARTGRLLVRQYSAESAEGFSLWVQTGGGRWTRAEQFEVLVSFAATLAEDMFRAEQLAKVAIDGEAPIVVRHVRDLEAFLDRLAVVTMAKEGEERARSGATGSRATVEGDVVPVGAAGVSRRSNLVTFGPDGPRGVAAYLEGRQLANA